MTETAEITAELARYIASAATRPLPEEVAAKAQFHLVDTLAAIVSGRTLPAGRGILPYLETQGGTPSCSVPGTAVLTTPALAALANGMAAHADETDDSHAPSLTHPGCVAVPAALASAEANGRSGRDLLIAVALGYDVGTRVSMALGGSRFADTYHLGSHGWGGTFGATAAAAMLAGLDETATRHALSYAVQSASGNRCWVRDRDHVQKAFQFAGIPAKQGVEAAGLAAAGLTGVGDAMEGVPGLFAAFPLTSDPALAVEELGTRFEVMRTTIKKWTVGSPIQMALDCIHAVATEEGITEPEIADILVTLPGQRSRVAQSDMPDVNLPHALALYLVDGGVGFASLHDHDRMKDPEVRRVAAKVRVEARPGAARGEQAHFTLQTTDGRRIHMEREHVRGQPANPMTEAEIDEKALDLFGIGLGADRARPLLEALKAVETVADVRDLRPLWQ
ncbi:MmgE/PrpD family protein [Rhodobacterales bacterium HKCCE2091]|nr:MmgE/PrpD family protein [Rhodobacterales bacterium HKCCE2091]